MSRCCLVQPCLEGLVMVGGPFCMNLWPPQSHDCDGLFSLGEPSCQSLFNWITCSCKLVFMVFWGRGRAAMLSFAGLISSLPLPAQPGSPERDVCKSAALPPSQGEISCAWNISGCCLFNIPWTLPYWSDVLLPGVRSHAGTWWTKQDLPNPLAMACSGHDLLRFPFYLKTHFNPLVWIVLPLVLFLFTVVTSWLAVCSLSSI